MFDINQVINQAIATAVDQHITAIKQEHANAVGALAERLDEAWKHIEALNAKCNQFEERKNTLHLTYIANQSGLKERLDALELAVANPKTDQEKLDAYFKQDALTSAFVEKLNNAEWFWDKVNSYANDHIERMTSDLMSIESVHQVIDEKLEEWKGEMTEGFDEKVQEVKDELADEVDEKVQRAVDDIDLSDAVNQLLRSASVTIEV